MVKKQTKKFLEFLDKYYSHHRFIVLVFILLGFMIFISSYMERFQILGLLLSLVMLLVHIFFIIIHALARSVKNLLHEELTIFELLTHYIYGTFAMIMFFALLYFISELLGFGSLQCISGTCHGWWTYIYFSSITYFTIGYGDILPTGFNQGIAVVSALAWNIFTVVIMALSLSKVYKK